VLPIIAVVSVRRRGVIPIPPGQSRRPPCLSESRAYRGPYRRPGGGKWWVKDRPLETISVKRVAGPPVSVGQPRAATAVRFFRFPSDAFWTKSAPHVEVGRALQRIECFLWRHGRLVHAIMSMLRDQAARRRMELNPITTQLNVIQQQQAHHTPISAVSANSLSAQFGHHPVAAYTPLSAVREYNPQQWAPSPGGVADHGHGQPQFASGRPRDLEGRIMAPNYQFTMCNSITMSLTRLSHDSCSSAVFASTESTRFTYG